MWLIEKIKSILFKRKLRKSLSFIEHSNGIFLNLFSLNISFPEQRKYIFVGENSMLDCSIHFETSTGTISVGQNTFVGNSTLICKTKIEIGDNVFIAWGGYIYDHDSHSLDYREREKDILRQLDDYKAGRIFIANKDWSVVNSRPIKICSNAWIGMNCTILKGVTIGQGAIVAAGSVVTKDVLPWTVVAGNPAKFVKDIPENLRKE